MNDFIIKEETTDKKHFTMLPNILSYIGLSANERSVYWAIKQCSGEDRTCTKSIENLCILAGIKRTCFKETMNKLCEINKFINKPLIKVVHRLKNTKVKNTNEIIIIDIWEENIDEIKEKFHQSPGDHPKVIKEKFHQSPGDQGSVATRLGVGRQTTISNTHYQNPIYKTPPPPTTPSKNSGGGGVSKKAIDFSKLCKDNDCPIEEILLIELYDKYPQATLNMVYVLAKRIKNYDKLPYNLGGWFREGVRKENEILKKKHENLNEKEIKNE